MWLALVGRDLFLLADGYAGVLCAIANVLAAALGDVVATMVDQLLRACVCNGVIQLCCRCIICCIGFCCIGVVKAAIQRIQLTLMVPARLHRIQLIQYTARIQYTAYTVYSTIPPLWGKAAEAV